MKMTIDYEKLQQEFDDEHLALNDPLNDGGISEEEAIAQGILIDITNESEGFVITSTIPEPADRDKK